MLYYSALKVCGSGMTINFPLIPDIPAVIFNGMKLGADLIFQGG